MKKILRVILFSLVLLLGLSDAQAQRFSETLIEKVYVGTSGIWAESFGSTVLFISKQSVTVIMGERSVKYKIMSRAEGTITTYDHINKCFDFWIIEPKQVQRLWVNRQGLMVRIYYLNRT